MYLNYHDKDGATTDSLKEIRKVLLSNRANSSVKKKKDHLYVKINNYFLYLLMLLCYLNSMPRIVQV